MLISNMKSIKGFEFLKKGWVFERKYDGIRCIVVKKESKVSLFSRNKLNLTRQFPEIVQDLSKQRGSFIADGEIIADSFYHLLKRIRSKNSIKFKSKISLQLFDIINNNGKNLKHMPFLERKRILRKRVKFQKTVKYVRHVSGNPHSLINKSKSMKWEGIIAKKIDAPYTSGRTKNAIKFVNLKKKHFYIYGYTKRTGKRKLIRSIILGLKNNSSRYIGSVHLKAPLEENKRIQSTFSQSLRVRPTLNVPRNRREKIHWVCPKWKVNIAFLSYTNKKRLREPRLIIEDSRKILKK